MSKEIKIIEEVIFLLESSNKFKDIFSSFVSSLNGRLEIAKSNKYRLGVLGVTSSGKSTMLNALLGKRILPAMAKPSSSQMVACNRGKEWALKVFFENKATRTYNNLNTFKETILNYGDESHNPNNREGVEQIEVTSPLIPLPEDLILVDSPGLDAHGLEGHEKITMHMLLPTVDFCIFVTNCKSNSDHKTQEVLDAIADYDKPVILVQNMIDALKGTPDGKKSVNEVAKEHLHRLQRIVDNSKIKNKNSVHILQISSIYALAAREILTSGRQLNEKGKLEYKKSNFDILCKSINEIFNSLKPEIENKRIKSLGKELYNIMNSIPANDSSPIAPLSLDYDSILREINSESSKVRTSIESVLDELERKAKEVNSSYRTISASEISEIKRKENELSNKISKAIQKYNEFRERISQKLNIQVRDLFISTPNFQRFSLTNETKTVITKQKKKGVWNWLKRTFGSESGYETITSYEDDYAKNKSNAISFLKKSYDDIKKRTDEWNKGVEKNKNKLIDIVEQKREEFQEFNKKIEEIRLSNESLKTLRSKLEDKIKEIDQTVPINKGNKTYRESLNDPTFNMSVPRSFLTLYQLSNKILFQINAEIWNEILNQKHIQLYGWDETSVKRFLSIICETKKDNLQKGEIIRFFDSYLKIYLNPDRIDDTRNDSVNVIFLNAIQPGAMKKQLVTLFKNNQIKQGKVIFLIQDLDELVNGEDIIGSLKEFRQFFSSLGFSSSSYYILPVDENPLYTMAMYIAQKENIRSQKKEMEIIEDLRSHFPYLFESKTTNIISQLIRTNI